MYFLYHFLLAHAMKSCKFILREVIMLSTSLSFQTVIFKIWFKGWSSNTSTSKNIVHTTSFIDLRNEEIFSCFCVQYTVVCTSEELFVKWKIAFEKFSYDVERHKVILL